MIRCDLIWYDGNVPTIGVDARERRLEFLFLSIRSWRFDKLHVGKKNPPWISCLLIRRFQLLASGTGILQMGKKKFVFRDTERITWRVPMPQQRRHCKNVTSIQWSTPKKNKEMKKKNWWEWVPRVHPFFPSGQISFRDLLRSRTKGSWMWLQVEMNRYQSVAPTYRGVRSLCNGVNPMKSHSLWWRWDSGMKTQQTNPVVDKSLLISHWHRMAFQVSTWNPWVIHINLLWNFGEGEMKEDDLEHTTLNSTLSGKRGTRRQASGTCMLFL